MQKIIQTNPILNFRAKVNLNSKLIKQKQKCYQQGRANNNLAICGTLITETREQIDTSETSFQL